MKKLSVGAVAAYLLTGASAYAGGLNVELNIGQPAPVYVAPAPVYYPPPVLVETYDPHHRRHDWRYWHEHHEHWEHEHHDHDHWDHDHR